MPTQAAREARTLKLNIAFAVIILIFVSLSVARSCSEDRKRDRQTKALSAAIAENRRTARAAAEDIRAACMADNRTRRQSNEQIRRPLKDMFGYFVGLVQAQIKADVKAGTERTPEQKARSRDFLRRFRRFYASVTLLAPLDCTKLGQ